MLKRVTRGWLVRAGIASAVGAAAILVAVTMIGGGASTHAAGDVQWTAPTEVHAVGSSFNIDLTAVDSGAVNYGGYNMELVYSQLLSFTGASSTGVTACQNAAANYAFLVNNTNTPGPGFNQLQSTCVFNVNNSAGGVTDHLGFTCQAPGTSVLHLETLVEDSITGSQFFDENANTIPTDLFDGSVTCTLPITKSDDTGGTAIAGSTHSYTIHVGNPTALSSFGHTISDTAPAAVTVTSVTSTNGALDGCGNVGNVVTCTTFTANSPGGSDVTVNFTVPLSSAGTNGVCNTATLDAATPGATTSNNDCFNVAPAGITVTKVADAASYQAGDPISWTITVTSTGPSPAANVVVTDTPTDGWTATDPLTYNLGTVPAGPPTVIVIHGNVNDPNPADNSCNNSVSVTSDNTATQNASASATCLSKNARMVKSTDCDNLPTDSNGTVNLFLDNNGSKANPLGSLTVCEWALNVGGDPQGVGAFEFDLGYDNSIFSVNVVSTNWLYDTDENASTQTIGSPAGFERIPDAGSGVGGCVASIFTENDVRFGCVSKNPQPLNAANGSCLGDDNVTAVAGAVCGQKDNGVIARITVTPKADLLSRITPGNDNGVISSLLDSGCEFADIWGHPLSTATGAPPVGGGNGYDALGREIPLPGISAGGQVIDCGNLTVTVRVLEGDMNTDCSVDVTDDQMEATHYGANFGSLLYDHWFDLEPALRDGDVDIKDLQKVFGRNGSTCANPVPPQPALPQPGDP
jgi:uncharacterized repeat protein (TIGR01451 family)